MKDYILAASGLVFGVGMGLVFVSIVLGLVAGTAMIFDVIPFGPPPMISVKVFFVALWVLIVSLVLAVIGKILE